MVLYLKGVRSKMGVEEGDNTLVSIPVTVVIQDAS